MVEAATVLTGTKMDEWDSLLNIVDLRDSFIIILVGVNIVYISSTCLVSDSGGDISGVITSTVASTIEHAMDLAWLISCIWLRIKLN